MFKKIGEVFKADSHKKKIDKLVVIVDRINALEPQFEKLDDEQLGAKTNEYRARLEKGESLDDLLPEAFATVREAGKRVLGQRPYDVQLICGINLHQEASPSCAPEKEKLSPPHCRFTSTPWRAKAPT